MDQPCVILFASNVKCRQNHFYRKLCDFLIKSHIEVLHAQGQLRLTLSTYPKLITLELCSTNTWATLTRQTWNSVETMSLFHWTIIKTGRKEDLWFSKNMTQRLIPWNLFLILQVGFICWEFLQVSFFILNSNFQNFFLKDFTA